jgi:hypothetical protein
MARSILALSVIVASLLSAGCRDNSAKAPSDSSHPIGKIDLYTFTPDDNHFLADAQPFVLPSGTSLKEALERLGQDLATTYFSKTYTGETTDIHFEIRTIDRIATPSRTLRVAVINMVDRKGDAMKYFFQGSAGGQTTFHILAATFMQPHLSPPLLDGLVLLYNGKILPELDHISLTGILIPRSAEHVAKRAIYGNSKTKTDLPNRDPATSRKLKS